MTPQEKGEVYAEYDKKPVEGAARFTPVVVKIIAITNSHRPGRRAAK
jgi:hypothetical protein